jgi:hypothetical protein
MGDTAIPKTFQIPATLEGVAALKDGGMSVRFHTQEINPDEKVLLMRYFQKFGWLLFSEKAQDEDTLTLEDIRKDVGGKTPSQRLRSVLYILYQQSGRADLTFEQFYAEKMERIIDQLKGKLAD